MTKKKNDRPKLPRYVIEKDGFWYVRRSFPTPYFYDNGGRRYVQIVRACSPKTADAAQSLSNKIEAEWLGLAQSKPITEQTVYDHLLRFIEVKSASVATRTYEAYIDYADRHVKNSEFGKMRVTAVKPRDVQQFYAVLGATPSVTRKLHRLLSSMFIQAVRWDDLPRNPCNGVVLPRESKSEIVTFTVDEAKRFIEGCRKSDSYIVFEFALETGARPGEYLALSWGDIDLDKCECRIRRAFASGLKGGGFEIKDPKTKSSRRTIRFSETLRDRLLVQKALVEDLKKVCRKRIAKPLAGPGGVKGVNYRKNKASRAVSSQILKNLTEYDLVFPSEKGLPRSINNINRREFKPLIEALGFDPERYSLYNLRHSSISIALASGADLKTVSERAGHADVTTTLNIYQHVMPSMRDQAIDRLAEALY